MKKFYILLIALAHFGVLRAQTHFTPDFEGNGFDHMNIFVVESVIEGADMQAGDEIAVFDGAVCAGVFVLNEALTDGSIGLINASKADQDTSGAYLSNGYTPGNALSFKLWDASHGIEYEDVDITFVDNQSGEEVDPVPFTVGASVFVRVIVDYPCMFEVYPNTLSIDSLGEEVFAPIITYHAWEVTAAPDWILFDNPSGFGSDTLNINISVNHGVDRSGVIELEGCDGLTESISVEQEGPAPCTLSVSTPVLTRSSDAGIKGVNVLSNSSWEVASSPSWITVSPLSGFGDGRVTLDYEANTSAFRTGVVTLTSCDDAVATITVNQLGVLPCELSVQESILDVSEVIGSQDVGVLSNADWTVTDAPAWVTVTPLSGTGDGSVNVSWEENISSSRQGIITLMSCEGVTATITVNQAGAEPCVLSVENPVLTRSSDAGIKGVNVLSNSSWEVASSPSWITVSPLSGFGDGRVTLDYEANTSAFRTGVVTLTSCDDAVATITVNQLGVLPCELSVQESILDVSEVIGSQDVGVLSNADWTFTDAPAWVTVTPLSGTGDGSVNVSWEENISSSRQGIITLMSCEGVTATITVNQAGAEPCVLSVENPVLTRSSDAGIKGVNVLSNSSWEVASSPSWITVSPLSGFGDGRVTLDYEANTSAFRTGVVTLTSCDDAVATITVNQLGVLPCELSVQESILDVSEVIGSQDVGVLSNADWTFTDAPAWVTVTPLSGTGDGSVNVSWEENISSSRQGIITLMSCEGVTATITVNQAGAEPCVLSVENPVLTRSSDAGIKGVNVLSNSSWEVASSPSWITVSPLSGFGDGRVTLDYEANTSAFRTGVVTLTSCDDAVATITVNQLGVLPCELSVQESILDVSEVIGSQDVGVLSNADWTVTDAPAWVTVTPLSGTGDGSVNVSWEENISSSRQGIITLMSCEGVTATITVNQAGAEPCVLSVENPVLTRSSDAGIKGVNVLSNSSWEVASSPSWITVSPLSGFGDGRVTLDYEANTSAFRTGVVTLTSCDDAVATITVNQLGVLPCELSVQESILDVSEVIGSQDVGVLSNADWTFTDAPAWVTVTPLSGTGDGSVNVSWEENISSSRQGIITLMSCEGVTATITVNQAGAEPCVLSVENPVLTRSSDAGIKGVNVLSNSSWEVASSPSWITVSPLSGFGDGRVTLDYEANTSAFRTGVVTLTSCDDAVATITVNQLGVLPCELSVQESILDVSEVIGSQDVGVLSNADWTFTDAPAWVTVTPLSGTGDGSVNVSWEENISSSRQGIITLMSCEGVTATITVNQAGAEPCVLSVENPVLTRSSDAGIKGVNVLSNSSWEVASSPSWITVSPLSGFGDGRVTLDYEANTSAFRTGVVTLTSCDDAVATITVNQAGVLKSALIASSDLMNDRIEEITSSIVYPNPFSNHLTIEFEKFEKENLYLFVFDNQGRMIKRIEDGFTTGINTIIWDAIDGSGNKIISGMYFIQLLSDQRKETFRVIYKGN